MVSLTNFRSVSELNASLHAFDCSEDQSNLAGLQENAKPNSSPKKYHFNTPASSENKQPLKIIVNSNSNINNNIHHSDKYDNQNHLDQKHPNEKLKQNPSVREHFEIRWNNLTYEVEPKWYRQKWQSLTGGGGGSDTAGLQANPAGKTSILNSLDGSVKSGQVTAILGPSGAGKTSLLGCLTGKNKSGVSGSVQVISERNEPMSICTIPQKG